MPKPVITVKNLTVSYGDQEILKNLSFTIYEGELAIVIGPNGSGKTTLLKAILGLIMASGEVKICDKSPQQALLEVSYVPQRFSFDATFPITVKEFLSLGINKRVLSHNNLEMQLKEVGMTEYQDSLIGRLSGGQLQRTLIAKALLRRPRLLFLDEPASGIDIEGEKHIYELIKHINQKHKVTVLMVSHELDIVYQYATKVLCLNRRLLCSGAPWEVLDNEMLRKLYHHDIGVYKHATSKHP